MIKNHQLWKWFVDFTLFVGLILAAMLDLTGLPIHQWLGLGVGLLAGYHLLAHWTWIRAVSSRLASSASSQARRYYLVDAGLFIGFSLILVTGLAMSTWFDLELAAYDSWYHLHVFATIGTLALTVSKVGLHWRWVINVGRKIAGSPARPAERTAPVPAPARVPLKPAVLRAPVDTGRRDFLRLMGVVGAAAVVAAHSALGEGEQVAAEVAQSEQASAAQRTAQPAANSSGSVEPGATIQQSTAQPTPGSAPTITQSPTSQAAATSSRSAASSSAVDGRSSCFVQCNRRCSYPGHCRRYRDSNGNGRCDYGECA